MRTLSKKESLYTFALLWDWIDFSHLFVKKKTSLYFILIELSQLLIAGFFLKNLKFLVLL